MRLNDRNHIRPARLAGALFVGAAIIAAATPAVAGGLIKERVYDDSFGNLIILNPSGYKRIVVGAGYLAAELNAEDDPEIVYLDGDDQHTYRYAGHCRQPSVLWKGRGYMYGLADNEIPTPPVVCD